MGKIFLNSIQYAGCAQGAGFSLSGTLVAGATTLTFTDARIKATSMVFPWCSIWGVLPTSVTVSAGSIVIVFPAQSADMEVGIAIDSDAFEINHEHVYSASEHIVGTWVDGSPIYEKTVYNAGGVSGSILIPHGISNLDKVISYEGFCYDDPAQSQYANGQYFPFPRISADNNNIGISGVDSTNVLFTNPTAFVTRLTHIYVTIRYTKTSA